MSEATERATRRDLRRAVGAEAIGVIDQNAKVLSGHAFVLDLHTKQFREAQTRIDTLADAQARHLERMAAFMTMSFWQRVRWFLGL